MRNLKDYDVLCEFVKSIPNGIGQKKFWDIVESTNFQALIDKVDKKLMDQFDLEIKKSSRATPKKDSKRPSVKKRKKQSLVVKKKKRK